jgi:hypothetical protein
LQQYIPYNRKQQDAAWGGSWNFELRLIKENIMDFTKIDFAKFDPAKIFDVDAVIQQMETNTKTATALITDVKARELAETVTAASFAFAKAQAEAARAFGEAVKRAIQI